MIVNLNNIPASAIPEIKEAYDQAQAGDITQWFWLIQQFNLHRMGNQQICGTCGDSIDILKEWLPKLWQNSQA